MKSFFLTSSFLIFSIITIAQTTIIGTVVDEKGIAIIGANIFIQDSYDGSSTEVDGTYRFTTEETGEQTLIFSYIGYENLNQVVEISAAEITLNVTLKEAANELNTVVISAGSFEASDEKKAVILNSIDIVTTAGATADIAGALNTLPGTQTVGEDGQLFVRGGASYETRTFIDGMFVQSPYNSTIPSVPARGRFSPFLFKGTMFSTGGYSAEYGQALSSALILNTQDLAPETVTGVSLMAVGTNLAHTKRWDKTSVSVNAGYTNLAPIMNLVPQNIDWIKPFEGVNGQFIFRHKTSETGILKFHAEATTGSFAINNPDIDNPTRNNELKLVNDNYYMNASFKEILGEQWSIFAGVSYALNDDLVEEGFAFDEREQSAQAKLVLSNQISDNWKLKFGGEYLKNDYKVDFKTADGEVFLTNLKEDYLGGFMETDLYLSRKLVARIGSRIEYSKLLNKINLAPRLSLAYKTSENAQMSFAFGQFYQNPENDLLQFNEELNFERADHYMLNYQLIKDRRTFRVETYYKKYHNLVKFNPDTPWLSDNSGDGHASGIDVFFRDKKTIKKGDYWISYSFLDTKRNYRDFPNTATPRFASKHNLSVVYKHWLPKITTSIGFTYSYGSPRPFNNPNKSIFNSERTKAYNDLSFNASYLTNLFGQFTVLYVSINNIPGFDNSFGYRYSDNLNEEGMYNGVEIKQTAKRMFFAGLFISIGQKFSVKDNQVPE